MRARGERGDGARASDFTTKRNSGGSKREKRQRKAGGLRPGRSCRCSWLDGQTSRAPVTTMREEWLAGLAGLAGLLLLSALARMGRARDAVRRERRLRCR